MATTQTLVRELKHGIRDSKRYCFILGSGASVESNIPMGSTMEFDWMNELSRIPDEEIISGVAELKEYGTPIRYPFDEIRNHWQEQKAKGKTTLDSKYYFDIYQLWQEVTRKSGIRYLEDSIKDKFPSYGYTVLSRFLASGNGSNLVITTNFDSLTETALRYYANQEAVIVNHESMASYADDQFTDHVMVAKIHNGLFYNAKNTPEETTGLSREWKAALDSIFRTYIPIVIGYGGGDHSLMDYLKNASLRGIFWCYRGEKPDSEDIRSIVTGNKGRFIEINGFDSIMIAIGNELFPEDTPSSIAERLKKQTDEITAKLLETYDKAVQADNDNAAKNLAQRVATDTDERTKEGKLTAFDYLHRGNQMMRLGQWDEAIVAINKSLSLDATSAVAFRCRGSCHYKTGRYDLALEDFNIAIRLDPNFALGYRFRALTFKKKGQYPEAIADYTKAISLAPQEVRFYRGRGDCYLDSGETEKAIGDYDIAISLDPENAMLYNDRGYAYDLLGRPGTAILDYTKSIELNPESDVAYSNRAAAYNELREYHKAIADCDKEISIVPNFPNSYNHRGFAHAGLGDHKNAIVDFSNAIARKPDYAEAYYNRHLSYKALGMTAKADADLQKAHELEPSKY